MVGRGEITMSKTYKQTANGTVVLQTVPDTCHCGFAGGPVSVDYAITLKFDYDSLDSSGFLLDNTAFRGYFTGLSSTPVDISCERLAAKVAADIIAMLGDRDAKLRYIAVTLSPFAGVAVHYQEKR